MDRRLIENINPQKMYRLYELEAETMLNCSRSFLHKLIYKGELESVKVGNSYRVPGWSVIEYLKRNYQGVIETL